MSNYGYSNFSGGKVGKVLAENLKNSPDEIVIVHHIWNEPDGALLQIERRDPGHTNCRFERIKL